MNIYLGTDIVYIPRIQAAIDRFGHRFLRRIYTPTEQSDYQWIMSSSALRRSAIAFLAGRWAAKEAVVKALGTGWQGIRYTDVEIQRQPNGAPTVCLYAAAAQMAAECRQWQLTLSHDGDYATATALLLCNSALEKSM